MTTRPRDRRVSRRLDSIAESATLKVDAKAKALKAEGRPVIGFGAGEPDFPTPAHIVEAAVEACRDERNHRYTPAGGLPEMKAAIVAKTRRDSGWEIEPAQVLVTNGGKQAIYAAFATMLDPGDEVIVPAPYWTTYPEAIQLAGGVPVPVVADETQDYKVSVQQLEAARTGRTKVVLFVSPSNPTGAVYSPSEARAIVAKTYAMTGWRVGWMIGPRRSRPGRDQPPVARDVERCQRVPTCCSCRARRRSDRRRGDEVGVRQASPAHGVNAQRDRWRRLPDTPRAFYAYPSVKGLLGKEYGGRMIETSAQLAEYLLDQAEVAAVPGEAFGTPGYLRFSYALGDADLVEGITRVQRLFAQVAS
jgi:aspartate aminotransferase